MPIPVNFDSFISKTPGFPKEGINFYNISPILEDRVIVKAAMSALCDLALPMRPDIIAGIDARGFFFCPNIGRGTGLWGHHGSQGWQIVR
jgi:adenine phosphoribosyltransferase